MGKKYGDNSLTRSVFNSPGSMGIVYGNPINRLFSKPNLNQVDWLTYILMLNTYTWKIIKVLILPSNFLQAFPVIRTTSVTVDD
jgi:hypothetical protein